ncbi:MAG: M16 family metallopeptidase [Gammaproteobacteria bacterium]
MRLFSLIILFSFICDLEAFSFPKIHPIKSNNNYLLVEEHALPIIDLRISFNYGSKNDLNNKGITNLAINLLEEQLLDGEKIVNHFEKIGAQYSSAVTKDTSYVSIRFVNNPFNISHISYLLNQMLTKYSITAEAFSREKELVLSSIKSRNLNPASIISTRSEEKFLINTGYAHPIIGYKKTIELLDLEKVILHTKKIINKNNIKISIVGDIDENKAAFMISKILSKISDNPVIEMKNNILNYSSDSETNYIYFDSVQTHISIIVPSVTRLNKNYFNILVANYIFGGSGFGSMLMSEIREKKGLAYSVYSYLMPYDEIGLMKIGMQTQNKNTKKAIMILKKEMMKLKEAKFSDEQINEAKIGLLRSFELRFDTNKKILDTLSAINELGIFDNYFINYGNGIKAVTSESLSSAIKSEINFDNTLITTVGNN